MSTTGTSIDELPTDTYTTTTEEFRADYLDFGEDEAVTEEEAIKYISGDDFISGPFFSEQSTVPGNILELHYSYGYDCKRYFNLCAPEENMIIFASGNLIHFFDIRSDEIWTRRSYLGGGIGHITCNPNPIYPHLAVAENGDNPPIIIYRWPELDIAAILKEGAAKRYAYINYSPDGELMVSQSYAPDFLITIWRWAKWKTSPIILRLKAHVTDVYKCMFSPYVPGQLTTSGVGHIKFWKMAETFTGLKLQGELGRFGKTEISDIHGLHPMPDEKIVSGSEWGNLLVWEAGLIKIEVFRTLRRKCHNGPIMQVEYIRNKGEIWSIAKDGWLRAWEYRIIDDADPPDTDRVVQMVPSYERENPSVEFISICKVRLYDSDSTHYFAQDGNGGIWLIDLILRTDYHPSKCLRRFHSGPVVDLQVCPWGPYLASLGSDGSLHLYDYDQMILIFRHQFKAKGRTLLWVPLDAEPCGCFLILGFDDGVIRIIALNIPESPQKIQFVKPHDINEQTVTFTLTQSIKPHNKPITICAMSPNLKILVTGGEDETIFIFLIRKDNNGIHLKPIGFCPLEAIPTCYTWHPELPNTIVIGCMHGELLQFTLPQHLLNYTKISYLLHTLKPIKNRFLSCKSLIRRRMHLEEVQKRKIEKVRRKRLEMQKLLQENPGLDIDEEIFLQDSESDEILEPLHVPKIPNRIIFLQFTDQDTIWVSVAGFDAGYIYEIQMDVVSDEPIRSTMVDDADDIEMHGLIYTPDKNYLITSMANGQIRVNRINPDNFRDLSDYWLLSMHDNFNGKINKMCFSYDKEFFFSCGDDGNLFSYIYNGSDTSFVVPTLERMPNIVECTVDENYKSLSLEEVMIKAEYDKQMRLANEHKRKLRNRLKELQMKLSSLLERNCNLPKSQRFILREFVIDERIMKALDERLAAKVVLEKRKLAYDVEKSSIALKKLQKHFTECLDVYPIDVQAFHKKISVSTISQRSLGKRFYEIYGIVEKKVEEEFLRDRIPVRKHIVGEALEEKKRKAKELEPFLVGLSPSTIEFKLGAKLTRLLKRYRERRAKKEMRAEEWSELYSKKPDSAKNHPADEESLVRAEAAIGDFKLKTSADYKVPEALRETMVIKYQQVLDARLKEYKDALYVYNRKIYKLRDEKVRLIEILKKKQVRIFEIHEELPECRKIFPLGIPDSSPDDFPEENFQLKMNIEESFQQSTKKKKPSDKSATALTRKQCDIKKMAYRIDILPDLDGSARDIIRQTYETITPFKNILLEDSILWESEMKARRLVSLLFEQDELDKQISKIINEFDIKVKEAIKDRYVTRITCNFMQLHILVLNQELIIVKDFETYENELSVTAIEKFNLMMDMKDNMKRTELKIEKHLYNIEKCNEEIKDLQQTFLTASKDNKFWDFLRRIFKKKWRPPKVINPDDSDSSSVSSSSSSSSEEDDAASIDSRDIGPIRLDESICPKGCDKEIYDYTFMLRNKRHDQERQILDEKKIIEALKKNMDAAGKKMKVAELASKESTKTLEEYRCKKQRALNEIPCTVVLKLSQLRHIIKKGNQYVYAKLSETLIFAQNMLNCLFTRVDELQQETLEERGRYRRNKLHLHRMTVDINFMSNKINKLKSDIVDLMLLKFGRKVNIDELEESILRRLVQDLKFAMLKFGEEYEIELERCRKIYGAKQIELKSVIRENTARLELLGVLNKERLKLARILEHQLHLKEKSPLKDELYYLEDIDKLVEISKTQKAEIQHLKEEIKVLNTKSLPLDVVPSQKIEKFVDTDKEVLIEFDETLDELYVPSEYKPEIIDYTKESLETNLTEDELIICTQELMTEIAETNIKLTRDIQHIIPKILCEIIEQVPLKYLRRPENVDHISNIMCDVITDISNIDHFQLIEAITRSTTVSRHDVTELLRMFMKSTSEKIDKSKEQTTETSEITTTSEKSTLRKTSEVFSTTEKLSSRKQSLSERSSLTGKTSSRKQTTSELSGTTEKSSSTRKKPSSEALGSIGKSTMRKTSKVDQTSSTDKTSTQKRLKTELVDKLSPLKTPVTELVVTTDKVSTQKLSQTEQGISDKSIAPKPSPIEQSSTIDKSSTGNQSLTDLSSPTNVSDSQKPSQTDTYTTE